MALIKTKTVLDALQSTLEALVFPEGHAFDGQNIFEAVHLYSIDNVERAVVDLIEAANDRLCFVIPVEDDLRHKTNGAKLSTTRMGGFRLILSDRDYEPGEPAFMGDGSVYPGLVNMKDTVIEKLLGHNLGMLNVVVMPMGGETYKFQKSKKDVSGAREAYVMDVDISMGRTETAINRGTSIYRR